MTIIRETVFDLLTRKRKGEKYGTPNGILSKFNDSVSVMLVEKKYVRIKGAGGGLHFFFGQKMFSLTFKGPVLLNSMLFTPTKNSKYFFRNPCKRE